MRRFLFWTLPIAASLAAVAIFAYGFVSYLRGDTGTPVQLGVEEAPSGEAPEKEIAAVILGDSLARGAGDQTGLGIGGRLDAELARRNVPAARRSYNVAVNGARTADLLEVLERANVRQLLRESNVVVVSIGGNDLWGGSDWRSAAPPDPDATMDAVLDRIETAVDQIRAATPEARIFFIGLFNPFAATSEGAMLNGYVNRWNSRLAERFADDSDFTLVQTADLFSHRDRLALDRFHPGGEGYELIARRIADAL